MAQSAEELKYQIAQQRNALGQDLDALGDRISPRRIAERRKAAISTGIHSVKERVMGTASSAGSTTSGMASSAAGAVGEAPEAARRQVEGNPLAAGAFAFAAGLVVAALLPETEREREVAQRIQPQVEQVASEVGKAAQESAQHLQPAAQEAATHVKEQAQQSAGQVRDEAQRAAEQRSDAASPGSRGAPPRT